LVGLIEGGYCVFRRSQLRVAAACLWDGVHRGCFFDYYDLYLFIYLEKVLAREFALTAAQSGWLQFTGLAGVGLGALGFGYLADRFGRGRMMLAVFGVYVAGIAGLSLAWSYGSLLGFRLLASISLGAEWGISHAYLAERVSSERRYRLSALLQFAILGGLLAALMARYALPVVGVAVVVRRLDRADRAAVGVAVADTSRRGADDGRGATQ
jgi:MFS family permease